MSINKEARLKGAHIEADRCIQCWEPPCTKDCPAGIDVSGFIRLIRNGDILGAAEVIEESNPMGLICGWICPQQALCQKNCTSHKLGRPIDIRTLQRCAVEYARKQGISNSFASKLVAERQNISINGKTAVAYAGDSCKRKGKVAIIGAGPSGLVCALYLQKYGHRVEVFEKNDYIGGRLLKSIPDFRLPEYLVIQELKPFLELLSIHYGKSLGGNLTIDELFTEGFDAVYIATGKWKENIIGIKGSRLKDVFTADEILTCSKWKSSGYISAAILGAGNVSMDVARTLLENGLQNVHIIYRRTPKEMTAWTEERDEVWHDGAIFHLLAIPVEIAGDASGRVSAVLCHRAEAVNNNLDGRSMVRALKDCDFKVPVDMVVSALGYRTDREAIVSQRIQVNYEGYIEVDNKLSTSIRGVFAGGDVAALQNNTAVQAVADGKSAAINIHDFIVERGENND